MPEIAYIRARMEPGLKADVDTIFDTLGVTTTQVITMLYKEVQRSKDLPLGLHNPNKETAHAIKNARKGTDVVKCKNADDFFDKLGI